MAVSGTTSFSVNRDQIIQYALRKCGVLELGVTPDATTVSNTALALDMMIKSWITKGIKLWTVNEITFALTSNKSTYVIGPSGSTPSTPDIVTNKPMKLIQAWIRNTSYTTPNDIPLQKLAQKDYNELGNKFSTGTPNSIYLDVGRDQSTVKLFVSPDVYSQSNLQVHLVTQRQLMDTGSATNNLDFPQEWLYAMGWNLAAEIATDYGVPESRMSYIEAKAMKLLDEVEGFDQEYASIFFNPDMRSISR